MISEICMHNNIEFTKINNYSIFILKKGDIERIIWSKKFQINSLTSARIADNKSATYSVLSIKNIPCVEHYRIAVPFKNGHYEVNEDLIKQIRDIFPNNEQFVIKPENGTSGKDVFLCNDAAMIKNALEKYSKAYPYVAVSPYYCIKNEYRTFYFNGENLLTYKKILPSVIGDGTSTINELVNHKYGKNNRINIDESLKNSILKQNEKMQLSWKFNLSNGSNSKLINDVNQLKEIHRITSLAAKAIQINFATVDIVELVTGEYKVLEINSGVVMERFIDDNAGIYQKAKGIYEKVILHMFREDNK